MVALCCFGFLDTGSGDSSCTVLLTEDPLPAVLQGHPRFAVLSPSLVDVSLAVFPFAQWEDSVLTSEAVLSLCSQSSPNVKKTEQ